MNWLDKQVSIYNSHTDTRGRAATLRDILFTDFATPHHYWNPISGQTEGPVNDLDTIIALRKLNPNHEGYDKISKPLKGTMQCFASAALMDSRKQGQIKINELSGLMQFDFDRAAVQDYDLEELKAAVIDLPFIAFCSLSCSGNGFYALASIAEPERLEAYAEHCFRVFESYAITPDTSKGRNVNDLRYVSYDSNMLIKKDPEPLRIKRFAKDKVRSNIKQQPVKQMPVNSSGLLRKALFEISNADTGNRWPTVRKWAYTLGGAANNAGYLDAIKNTINNSAQYSGYEDHCIEVAEDSFKHGSEKLLTPTI